MKKRYKILILIGAILLAILIVGQLYLNSIIEKVVNRELNSLIEEQKDDYEIQVGDIQVRFLLKRIILYDVKIKSLDSNLIDRNQHFDLEVDKIVLKINRYTEVYNSGLLQVKDLELHRPKISLLRKKDEGLAEHKDSEIFESSKLKKIDLGGFGVNKGSFTIYELKEGVKSLSTSGNNVDVFLNKVSLDFELSERSERILIRDVKVNIGELEIHEIRNHKLKIAGLIFTDKSKPITIDKISFKNDMSLDAFKSKNKKGSIWTDIKTSNINLLIDLDKALKRELDIKSLDLGELDLALYSISQNSDSSNKSIGNPLERLQLPLIVDSISVRKGKGWLKIQNDKGVNEFPFKNLGLKSFSISNDSLFIANHPEIFFELNTTIWNRTAIESKVKWHQTKNTLIAKIQIDRFPESEVKGIFEAEKLGELRSCKLDRIDVDIILDSSQIQGEARLGLKSFDARFNQLGKGSKLDFLDVKSNRMTLSSSFIKEDDHQISIQIDSIYIKKPALILREKNTENETIIASKKAKETNGPLVSINKLYIEKASFSYFKRGQEEALIQLDELNFKDRFILLDFSKKGKEAIINTGSYSLGLTNFNFYSAPSQYLTATSINIQRNSGLFILKGIRYKNKKSKNDFHKSSKEGNTWLSAYVEELSLKTDLKKILEENITIDKVEIIRPIATYINAVDREENSKKEIKHEQKEIDLPIYISEVNIIDGDVDFRLKTDEKREAEVFDLSNVNASIKNIDFNEETKQLRSSIYGKLNSNYYNSGKITLNFQQSQRSRNAKTTLKGSITNLSLNKVKDKLSVVKELNYKSGSIDEIEFDIEIRDQELEGDLKIKTLEIAEVHLSEKKNEDWFSVDLESANIYVKKDKDNRIISRSVNLINPHIDIHHPRSESKKTKSNRKDLLVKNDVYENIASISNFEIKGGRIRQFDGYDNLLPLTSVNNVNITGNRLIVYDSTNTTLPVYVGGLNIELKNIMVHFLPHHDLTINSMNLDLINKTAHINLLEFKNKVALDDFYKPLKYRKAWMDLKVESMDIGVDLHEFFSPNPRIRSANINKAKFTTIVNLALNVSPDEKPLPNRILKNSTYPITVDSIHVNDGTIEVQFIDVEKYGLLKFNDIQALVSNLSTDKENIKKNDEMLWVMDATMWESGDTHVEVVYNLEDEEDAFVMDGTVSNMNLVDTDTLTKNLYGIKVNDGNLFLAEYHIEGNNEEADGRVKFDYESLHLSLDKKKKNIKSAEEVQKTKKKDKLNQSFVKSVVVNNLLRSKNSPEKGKYVEYGSAYFKREKNKPIFHLMWYTLSSGIIEIAESRMIKDFRTIKEGFNFKKKKKEE